MDIITGVFFGMMIGAVVSGIVIYIISALKLGIEVKNFGWAMIVGVVVGVLSSLINSFVQQLVSVEMSGILTAINHALVMATVIYSAGYWFKDNLKVKGFSGALIAALAMALLGYAMSSFV